MATRGRKPGRRVDRQKLQDVLVRFTGKPLRGSGYNVFVKIVRDTTPPHGRPLLGETACKKFFNGEPMSLDSEARFKQIFDVEFDAIVLDECVNEASKRLRQHRDTLEKIYERPTSDQWVAARMLSQIETDFGVCFDRRNDLEIDEVRDAALLAGELAGNHYVFLEQPNDRTIGRIYTQGLELAGRLMPYYPEQAFEAIARLFHNEPIHGGSGWDRPEQILNEMQVQAGQLRLRRAAELYEKFAGNQVDKSASQRISLARTYAQSKSVMLSEAQRELDTVRTIVEQDPVLESFLLVQESLILCKHEQNAKSISKLKQARELLRTEFGTENHAHVAAVDLRIAQIDSSALLPGVVDQAMETILDSPMKHLDAVDLSKVKTVFGQRHRRRRS